MITCDKCGKVYQSTVLPLHCRCGQTVGEYSEPLEPPYNAWAALHYYPVKYRHDWNPTRANRWYRHWVAAIPNSRGCGCKKKWEAMQVQFDFSTPRAFFESSVVGHNTVNATLGKPVITFEQAEAIWWPE